LRSCVNKEVKRRDGSNNWTRRWLRLAALTDYDRVGELLELSEEKAERCQPQPGGELLQRNGRAGQNGRPLRKRNSGTQ